MAKKKNYWYIMVITDNGPVFVTGVNYQNRTAEWNRLEAPKDFPMQTAEDLCMGLNLNFHVAFLVKSKFELDYQPYAYSKGKMVWENKKQEEDSQEGE